jgi:hypothetical protein
MEVHEIVDFVVRLRLLAIPGVAQVIPYWWRSPAVSDDTERCHNAGTRHHSELLSGERYDSQDQLLRIYIWS